MESIISIVSRDDTVEVLSLEAAKRDLDITFDDDDTLIQNKIDEAVDWVENHTNRFLKPVVVDLVTGCLPVPLRIGYGPVNGPIVSVTVDGVAVAGVQGFSGPLYTVYPPAGQPWPSTATPTGSVVRFNAGYAAGTVPKGIVGAVGAVVSILYDKPIGTELDAQWTAVERMLSIYRLRNL